MCAGFSSDTPQTQSDAPQVLYKETILSKMYNIFVYGDAKL